MSRMFRAAVSLLLISPLAHAQSSLTVLDYGAEPRAPLRYEYTVGPPERVTMVMSMTMTREVDGKQQAGTNLPATSTTMVMRVVEVAADGSALLEFKTESAQGASPQGGGQAAQAAMDRTLAGLSTLSGTYRVDTRGRLIKANIAMSEAGAPGIGETINTLLNDQMEGMQPLPDEPVGVGAKWRVSQRIASSGMELNNAQEFTLKSRSGTLLQIDQKVVSPPSSFAGNSGTNSMAGASETSGSGTMQIDLRKLMPTMEMEINSNTVMLAPAQPGAKPTKMMMQMRMKAGPATE